ncbi:helix-turn-helix transcriptional regulator, partial [Cloacibacillus porcorum]|uniref:helix-turn-helix transcriptional regulator n=1 Tax=Cloacibacillus porcorum TaxID=1197717 RepID=UPI003C6C5AA2
LSQCDLAKLAGVTKTTVVAWENDRFKPQRKLSELEKALKIPRGMLYILIAEDDY